MRLFFCMTILCMLATWSQATPKQTWLSILPGSLPAPGEQAHWAEVTITPSHPGFWTAGAGCEAPLILQSPSTAARIRCYEEPFDPLSVTATGTGLTYQWYINTTASASGGTAMQGAVSDTFTPPSAPPGTRYYYCVVTGACGSVTSQVSGAMTVRPLLQYRSRASGNWNSINTWQQFNGTTWETATSWPGSIQPVCTTSPGEEVYAEIRLGHQVTVNGNITFGSVLVLKNGSITLAPNSRLTIPADKKMTVRGNLLVNAQSLVTGNEIDVQEGSINIDSYGLLDFNSLSIFQGMININSHATLNTHTLAVSEGLVNINVGGEVSCHTLEATDGSVNVASAQSGSGSLIVTGTATGSSVTYSRYVSAHQWHLVSPPVSGQPISYWWASENYIRIPELDPMPPGPDEGGYTPYEFIEYHEPTNEWLYLERRIGESGDFMPAAGYGIQREVEGTVSFTGSVFTGEVTRPVTRSHPAGRFGWNLTGNPYPSALCLSSFLDENRVQLDANNEAIYFKHNGNYVAISGNPHLSGLTGQTEPSIQAGQGFFIKARSTGFIRFAPEMRIHQTGVPLKSAREGSWPGVRLTIASGVHSHSTVAAYHRDMQPGLDPGSDIGFLGNNSELEIYTRLAHDNGTDFMIQALPGPESGLYTVPVGINFASGGEVTFSGYVIPLPGNKTIYLEDRVTGILTDLSAGSYTATLPSGTRGTGRFFLRTVLATSVTQLEKLSAEPVVRRVGNRLQIDGEIRPGARITLTDITGRIHASYRYGGMHGDAFDLSGLPPGIYLVQIADGVRSETVRFVHQNTAR